MKLEETIKHLVDYYKGNTKHDDITIYTGTDRVRDLVKFLWDSIILTTKDDINPNKPGVYLQTLSRMDLDLYRYYNKESQNPYCLLIDIRKDKTWKYFKKKFMEYYYHE